MHKHERASARKHLLVFDRRELDIKVNILVSEVTDYILEVLANEFGIQDGMVLVLVQINNHFLSN